VIDNNKKLIWRVLLVCYVLTFIILTITMKNYASAGSLFLLVLVSSGGLLVVRNYLLGKKIILGKIDIEVEQIGLRRLFLFFSLVLLLACLLNLSGMN